MEYKQFDATVRKVLSVSRDELSRREVEWRRLHAGRNAGGRKKLVRVLVVLALGSLAWAPLRAAKPDSFCCDSWREGGDCPGTSGSRDWAGWDRGFPGLRIETWGTHSYVDAQTFVDGQSWATRQGKSRC